MPRQSTGVSGLDDHLGGGLLPGALTVVVGATGIGKTQFGVQFANAGLTQEYQRGVFFDVSARGDSQNHLDYAERMCNWRPEVADSQKKLDVADFFTRSQHGEYLHVFDYRGKRVKRGDLEFEQWREWQGELNVKLQTSIGFLYGNFINGCRRVVVDGVEPTDKPSDSIQMHLFEYVYHQVLRKEPEWVARDLLREKYLENALLAAKASYDPAAIGCLILCTSHETMLDDLISRGLQEGDILSNANTLIYMGKVRDGDQFGRGMYVAKHRGSACSDAILRYRIGENGLEVRG